MLFNELCIWRSIFCFIQSDGYCTYTHRKVHFEGKSNSKQKLFSRTKSSKMNLKRKYCEMPLFKVHLLLLYNNRLLCFFNYILLSELLHLNGFFSALQIGNIVILIGWSCSFGIEFQI